MKTSQLAILKIYLLIFLVPYATQAQNWGPATPFPDPNGPVWCMAEMNNELYVGGEFTMIGGVVANHIAKWNGSSWSAVGSGFSAPVTCVIAHNNKLYVGHGNYSNNPQNMEVWDGAVWSIALSGAIVQDFCIYSGQVIAATTTGLKIGSSQTWSNFGTQGGAGRVCVYNNEVYATNGFGNGISKWNGTTWIDVAGAVATAPEIYCMEVFNNKLVVGGHISSLGGVTVYDVAQFDGSSWSNVGFQDGLGTGGMSPGVVVDLYTQGTYLYMLSGPGYWSNNNGGYWSGLNRWDGSTWQNIGANGMAQADAPLGDVIINYNGNLIVGGHMIVTNLQTFVINRYLVGINNYFTSVPETSTIIFSVFPNPAYDILNVTWSQPNISTLTLTDAAGRAVRAYNVNGTQAQLSLEGLASGVYFLSGDGEEKTVQRIVKK